MILKRICLAALIFSFGVAGTAQARIYALGSGSGAQLHIGGGLALPIQAAATVTGGIFPPLKIPVAVGAAVSGTTTPNGDQVLRVPKGVLRKFASLTTVGLFASNPTLYAVATNLSYSWPAAAATFSRDGVRDANGPLLIGGVAPGNSIIYDNRAAAPSKRFGGAGAFSLKGGPEDGLHLDSPITIFIIANAGPAGFTPNGAEEGGGDPPCAHPAVGGGNDKCIAALIDALPTGLAAVGQALTGGGLGAIVTTPGGVSRAIFTPNNVVVTPNGAFGPRPAKFGIAVGAFTAGPPVGTVAVAALFTAAGSNGLKNNATSDGFPFTTGKITISAMLAIGAPEVFVISGNDQRTASGAGTIQMVAGALSTRLITGPNANRAWVRLVLDPNTAVPAMSTLAQGVMIVLLMLVPAIYFGTRARRRQAV